MTQEITVVPVDARRSDWYRIVATVLNRLQNTTAAAGVTATWGSIAGTLSDQTDLSLALASKQNLLVSGTNIKTVNGSSLLGSGNLAVGTVTSVAASVPTGFSIAGSPITGSGTLAITFTAGYSLPTDASQANWNTAYGWGNHASAGYLTSSAIGSTVQAFDADLSAIAALSGTNTIYYRSAANTWSAVTVGSGLSFSGGTLSASGGGGGTPGGSSGQIQYNNAGAFGGGDLSGDVTTSGGLATTIANDAVTYAKMQNVSATSRILGRKTASAGDTEECTLSEVLDFVGSAAQGDLLYRGASGWTRIPAGTSGQVLQTQGSSANPRWMGGVTLIEKKAFAGGETSFSFTSIPQGFSALEVEIFGRLQNVSGAQQLAFRLNADSSAIYDSQRVYTTNTTTGSDQFLAQTTIGNMLWMPGTSYPSGQAGSHKFWIEGYSQTSLHKSMHGQSGKWADNSSTYNQYIVNWSGGYRSTSAISSIDFQTIASSGQMVAGSYAILRGLP